MADKFVSDENLSDQNNDTVRREERILEFWREHKIFEQSINRPASAEPVGEFVFYDGPPFATGQPHFGHLLPTSLKDAVPRYQTMRGRRVRRRWGWDCHGLPIENLVEKELGLVSKKDIEKLGIAEFNRAARASVLRYAEDWKKIIPRLGRWVDMDNDYRTMDTSYTESVWWVFRQLWEKGLVYEGRKAMHLCPRCETTLANFEVNQGYKDVTDISIYVTLPLVTDPRTSLVIWTTTAWTLPGNVAVAVHPELIYAWARLENHETLIVAKSKLAEVLGATTYEVVKETTGADLVGLRYQPLFSYYSEQVNLPQRDAGWQIYADPFVSDVEGTGLVHLAPAFGEDDWRLGELHNLPFVQHVGRDGRFRPEVSDFAGQLVKPKDDPQATDVLLIKYLATAGRLFGKKKITHSYPHCWRCDTPLLNYAASSWFVKVTALRAALEEANAKINWVPGHLRAGRFGKWLAGARDWALSRQRYWGAPLPVWQCAQCATVKIIGSVAELSSTTTAGNRYLIMRHGEAESNVKNIVSSRPDGQHHLTSAGRAAASAAASDLREHKIDLIIASDFVRTRETAEVVAAKLGLPATAIMFDERLREINTGEFDGRPVADYRAYFTSTAEKFSKTPPGGENLSDLRHRVAAALADWQKQHSGRTILVITHEYVAWLMTVVGRGLDQLAAAALKDGREDFLPPAGWEELIYYPAPRNPDGELDLHRPYIDEVKFACTCGGMMKRSEGVFDVWFESGAMPYGQWHYPFNHRDDFSSHFPADFIAEGLDQTRGWFYSLLVLGLALFGQSPYRQVVVNGLILAEDGRKMSKRLNNYPDLTATINRYGADALRFYLLSSPAVRGEEFNFSIQGLGETERRVVKRLENVLEFYRTYQSLANDRAPAVGQALDDWIDARWQQSQIGVTASFDELEIDRAAKIVDEFIDDLSNWYLRRSRQRLKDGYGWPQFRLALRRLAATMAPLMPFLAEEVYRAVREDEEPISVHLTSWLSAQTPNESMISDMLLVRRLSSLGLEARATASIKMKQPLGSLTINPQLCAVPPVFIENSDLLTLIQDEVNVETIVWNDKLNRPVELDTTLTPALRAAGAARQLIRYLQDERKRRGLDPAATVTLTAETSAAGRDLIESRAAEIKKVVLVREINFAPAAGGTQCEVDNETYRFLLS
ncbi:MAG: class I tRNA ligase family protein [Patescibacteria group bacterium]